MTGVKDREPTNEEWIATWEQFKIENKDTLDDQIYFQINYEESFNNFKDQLAEEQENEN